MASQSCRLCAGEHGTRTVAESAGGHTPPYLRRLAAGRCAAALRCGLHCRQRRQLPCTHCHLRIEEAQGLQRCFVAKRSWLLGLWGVTGQQALSNRLSPSPSSWPGSASCNPTVAAEGAMRAKAMAARRSAGAVPGGGVAVDSTCCSRELREGDGRAEQAPLHSTCTCTCTCTCCADPGMTTAACSYARVLRCWWSTLKGRHGASPLQPGKTKQ
jgi:hypothetical protein